MLLVVISDVEKEKQEEGWISWEWGSMWSREAKDREPTEKLITEGRLEGAKRGPVSIWGERIPRRGNNRFKGPEPGS